MNFLDQGVMCFYQPKSRGQRRKTAGSSLQTISGLHYYITLWIPGLFWMAVAFS